MEASRSERHRRQRGVVIVQAAASMAGLIACIGLALDGGLAYLARARLASAVDGAALAAGRAAQSGGHDAMRRERAERVARDYLGSTYGNGVSSTVAVRSLSPHVHIEVAAQIPHSPFLLPLFGQRTMVIGARAEVSNRVGAAGPARTQRRMPVDVMMVTDMSGSILRIPQAWERVIAESKRVFEPLDERRDRVAQVVYSSEVDLPMPFAPVGFSKSGMQDVNCLLLNWEKVRREWQTRRPVPIDCLRGAVDAATIKASLARAFDGSTATGPALVLAKHQLAQLPQLPRAEARARILLLFTDGLANRFCDQGKYAVDSLGQKRCSSTLDDAGSRPDSLREAVGQMLNGINVARQDGIQVLIVGFGAELRTTQFPGPDGGFLNGEQWLLRAISPSGQPPPLSAEQTFSHGNDMYCWSGNATGLKDCYDKVVQAVMQTGAPGMPGATGPLRLIR